MFTSDIFLAIFSDINVVNAKVMWKVVKWALFSSLNSREMYGRKKWIFSEKRIHSNRSFAVHKRSLNVTQHIFWQSIKSTCSTQTPYKMQLERPTIQPIDCRMWGQFAVHRYYMLTLPSSFVCLSLEIKLRYVCNELNQKGLCDKFLLMSVEFLLPRCEFSLASFQFLTSEFLLACSQALLYCPNPQLLWLFVSCQINGIWELCAIFVVWRFFVAFISFMLGFRLQWIWLFVNF